MLQFKHFSAWIEVDGKELEQYGVEEDLEGKKVTCWIASQAGKNFSIMFKDNSPQMPYILAAFSNLDGTAQGGLALRPTSGIRTLEMKDVIVSPTTVRPYMFSKLQLTDDDEHLNQTAKHIGEIELLIMRGEDTGRKIIPDRKTVTQEKVHERSKKAMSHCVGYGPETQTTPQIQSVYHYPDPEPLVTFIFKYREEGILRANGIIQRPPDNEAPPPEAEVLDLTTGAVKNEPHTDEINALDDAILAMQRKRAVLQSKRQNSGGSQPPPKRIKREGKFVPTGEVIDLT